MADGACCDGDDIRHNLFIFGKIKLLDLQDDEKLSSEQEATKRDGELAALGIRRMLEFEPLRKFYEDRNLFWWRQLPAL